MGTCTQILLRSIISLVIFALLPQPVSAEEYSDQAFWYPEKGELFPSLGPVRWKDRDRIRAPEQRGLPEILRITNKVSGELIEKRKVINERYMRNLQSQYDMLEFEFRNAKTPSQDIMSYNSTWIGQCISIAYPDDTFEGMLHVYRRANGGLTMVPSIKNGSGTRSVKRRQGLKHYRMFAKALNQYTNIYSRLPESLPLAELFHRYYGEDNWIFSTQSSQPNTVKSHYIVRTTTFLENKEIAIVADICAEPNGCIVSDGEMNYQIGYGYPKTYCYYDLAFEYTPPHIPLTYK